MKINSRYFLCGVRSTVLFGVFFVRDISCDASLVDACLYVEESVAAAVLGRILQRVPHKHCTHCYCLVSRAFVSCNMPVCWAYFVYYCGMYMNKWIQLSS